VHDYTLLLQTQVIVFMKSHTRGHRVSFALRFILGASC
jgi:hypothetical protein